MDHGDNNVYLSIGTALATVVSFIVAHATTSNIAWGIGCVAGLVSIGAGVMTIREKSLNIKALKKKLQ